MYIDRLADQQLDDALRRSGAVLIEGPRASGKTATASRRAASRIRIDVDPNVAGQVAVDPSLVLEGSEPRLLDEWQLYPQLWNAVRRAVDEGPGRGRFILTGSTAPGADATRHTGAGRFARVRMRTMTLFESGDSDATVSLAGLIRGEPPRAAAASLSFDQLLTRIERGGWPGFADLSPADAAASVRDYVDTIAMVDVATTGTTRDPGRVRRLMAALARSTATEVTISTLARDESSLSRDAVRDYLDALSRIFVVEDQPAWSAHLRSSATLRKEPKRHFCDPSLALAMLGGDAAALRRDLGYTGQLFESLAVHDLRALSQPLAGEVFHARDSTGREVDAIVQLRDGSWSAFEIKLGATPEVVDAAAAALVGFAASVDHSHDPVLTVVTGAGASYRRADGVNVVALAALAP